MRNIHSNHPLRAIVISLVLGMGPMPWLACAEGADAIAPLPSRPLGPVTSTTPTTPPVLPESPLTPTAVPAPQPQDPGFLEAQKLLEALKGLADIKDPAQAAAAASDIAAKLEGFNPTDALGTLGSLMSGATGADLVGLAGVIRAAESGDLFKGLSGVYDELNRRYKLPNLSPEEKRKIYDQLQKLHGLLSNPAALKAALDKLKTDLPEQLKQAGLDAAANALNDLIAGRGFPKDLESLLKGTDLAKLHGLIKKTTECKQNPLDAAMRGVMGNGDPVGNHTMVVCD